MDADDEAPCTGDNASQYPKKSYSPLLEEEFNNSIQSESEDIKQDDHENKMIIKNVEAKIEEPKVGMVFDSVDELLEYYRMYGNEMGFRVSKRTSSKGDDGELRYLTVACTRSGKSKYKSRNRLKKNPKTNCNAKMRAVLQLDEKKWLVNSIVLEHNHELNHKNLRKMGPHVKRKLEANDRVGIQLNKSYNSLLVEIGGQNKVPVLEKDCRNYIEKKTRLRLGDGDAMALERYFLKMQRNNSDFFYTMDRDEDGRLQNVFWADARSRAAYREFGDVVTFDTTYLTKKYDIPLAPFIGVNHHGQSVLLGCGLISNENIETFVWLFQSWLACMHDCAPNAIITDQDKTMKRAIKIVFPDARHRWCLFHIMKKLPEKLRGYKQHESIEFSFQNVVYDSLTSDEFEEHWKEFITEYDLCSNEWLHGLYDERKRWVPAFVKDTFWAGMSTTQRSETMNSFFDGYVHSKTTLSEFISQYENALSDKAEKENQANFQSFNSWIPCITEYEIEKQYEDVYTMAKFKEFQSELVGKIYCELSSCRESSDTRFEFTVKEDKIFEVNKRRVSFLVCYKEGFEFNCNCRLFEFRGILCRHAILVLIHKQIFCVPDKYILRRWRKDIKRSHTKVKICYDDWSSKPEGRRFDKMCSSFYQLTDLAVGDDNKCNMVMQMLHDMKKKLMQNDCEYPDIKIDETTNGENLSHIGKRDGKILSQEVVQGNGGKIVQNKSKWS